MAKWITDLEEQNSGTDSDEEEPTSNDIGESVGILFQELAVPEDS